jgi:hypothetical protein
MTQGEYIRPLDQAFHRRFDYPEPGRHSRFKTDIVDKETVSQVGIGPVPDDQEVDRLEDQSLRQLLPAVIEIAPGKSQALPFPQGRIEDRVVVSSAFLPAENHLEGIGALIALEVVAAGKV